MILGPTGATGPTGDCGPDCVSGVCLASGTGATGVCGGTGTTGPTGAQGAVSIGFGYCGPNSLSPTGGTFNPEFYEYAGVTGITSEYRLLLFLGTASTGGGFTLEVPSPDVGMNIQNGVVADIRGETGATGQTGPVKIVNLGGISILHGNTFTYDGSKDWEAGDPLLHNQVTFKTLESEGDIHIHGSNDHTLHIGGLSANAADGVNMGLTGELLYQSGITYGDGATDTFWNASAWPVPSNASAYHEALTARLIDHREIIKRHGHHDGYTAYPIGFESDLDGGVNTQLSLKDGNIQKIYCGPTTGQIFMPIDDPITPYGSYGDGTDPTVETGVTHDIVQHLTLILHDAGNHRNIDPDSPYSGVINYDYEIFGEYGDHGDPSNASEKFPIFPEANQYGTWKETKFTKSDINNEDYGSVDILHFIRKPITDTEFRWYALNPVIGFKENTEYTYNEDNIGACCHDSYFEDGNGCRDYITAKECDALEGSKFFTETLCKDTGCIGNDGACCTMNGCIQTTEKECEEFFGYFVNDASCDDTSWSCNNYPCDCPSPPLGACCFSYEGAPCVDCIQLTERQCSYLGNKDESYSTTFKGVNTVCGTNSCGSNTCTEWGSCCHMDSECNARTICSYCNEDTCTALGSIWRGYDVKHCNQEGVPDTQEKWIGCYCLSGNVFCEYANSFEEIQRAVGDGNASGKPECQNIVRWNPSSLTEEYSYPDGWIPCFGTEVIDGIIYSNPSASETMCEQCDECNCAEQAQNKPLGRCCFDFNVPVGNQMLNCLTNYDEESCYALGGTDWEEGGSCPGTCAAVVDEECIVCDETRVCCLGGLCRLVLSEEECENAGGTFYEEYAACEQVDCCIDTTGACCFPDGCEEVGPQTCAGAGGIFQGIASRCTDPSIECCIDDSQEDLPGACCCEYNTDCVENLTSGECALKQQTGMYGLCEHYPGLACDESGCPTNVCSQCPVGDDRVSWHIFVSSRDSFFDETDGVPQSKVWGKNDYNSTQDLSSTDAYFGPALTRKSDGYWNTYGWWSYSGNNAWDLIEDGTTNHTWNDNPYTNTYALRNGNNDGCDAPEDLREIVTDNAWREGVPAHDDDQIFDYPSERGLVVHSHMLEDTIWQDDLEDKLRGHHGNDNSYGVELYNLLSPEYKTDNNFDEVNYRELLEATFFNPYVPSIDEFAYLIYQMTTNAFLAESMSSYDFSGDYWTSSAPDFADMDNLNGTVYGGVPDQDYAGPFENADPSNPVIEYYYNAFTQTGIGSGQSPTIKRKRRDSVNKVRRFVRVMETPGRDIRPDIKFIQDPDAPAEEYRPYKLTDMQPGSIVKIPSGMQYAYGPELIYVGLFTPGCSKIMEGLQGGNAYCSTPLPSGPCCTCETCYENPNSYVCLHQESTGDPVDKYWPWESYWRAEGADDSAWNKDISENTTGYMWKGSTFDNEGMYWGFKDNDEWNLCPITCDAKIQNDIISGTNPIQPALACNNDPDTLDNLHVGSLNTFTYFDNLLPTGACCGGENACEDKKKCNCDGNFRANILCAGGDPPDNNCVDDPIGACCVDDSEQCIDTTQSDCDDFEGVFHIGQVCTDDPCDFDPPVQTGACCLNGECSETTSDDCLSIGGYFTEDQTCENSGGTITCIGACCDLDVPDDTYHACLETDYQYCMLYAGEWQGDGSNCADANCETGGDPAAACCIDGNCSVLTQQACADAGGQWYEANSNCGAVDCPGNDYATFSCCDDNDDGVNDYWALRCPNDDCWGCKSGNPETHPYPGVDKFQWGFAGAGANLINDPVPTQSGIRRKDNGEEVNKFKLRKATGNQIENGCPCTEKINLNYCYNNPNDDINCKPECCEWNSVDATINDWNGNNNYAETNFPNINWPFSEVVRRNPFSGTPYIEPDGDTNSTDVLNCGWTLYSTINPSIQYDWPGAPLLDDIGYGGWDPVTEYAGEQPCPPSVSGEPFISDSQKFISGTGFNIFSYTCTPWEGILSAGANWWDTGWWDGDSWDIPEQSSNNTGYSHGAEGINPSYARKFKFLFETFDEQDHIQLLQLPWPKGAKDENEAWSRVRCYLDSLKNAICKSDPNDFIDDANPHLWLSGWDTDLDGSLVQSNDAERFLGYAASPHWVLYDSGCVNTHTTAPSSPATRIYNPGVYSLCVPYNYPACPLRIDQKQVQDHVRGVGLRVAAGGEWKEEKNFRLEEGYGPGGQGPLPPIVVNFNDCNLTDNLKTTDKWWARVSECSGRSCLLESFGSSTTPHETSTVGVTSKASSTCEIYKKVLDEYGVTESGENAVCSNEAEWQRESCADDLDSSGNIKGICVGSSGNTTYASAKDCPNGNTWIYDNVSTRINNSLCSCDCTDCLYPDSGDGTVNERDKEKYSLQDGSCCISLGAKGWPGVVNEVVSLPWDNINTDTEYYSWLDQYDDGVHELKATDLVGWLCGWNSIAHEYAKNPAVSNSDTGCWKSTYKYCLDSQTCPALFDGSYDWTLNDPSGECWSPENVNADFCTGEFITSNLGMNLSVPLNCEGCQLGAISSFDSAQPSKSLDGSQGNTVTRRNLRGIPKKDTSCFGTYNPTPLGACCGVDANGDAECKGQISEYDCNGLGGTWYYNQTCEDGGDVNCAEQGTCCSYDSNTSEDIIILADISSNMTNPDDNQQCFLDNPNGSGNNAMQSIVPVLQNMFTRASSNGDSYNMSIFSYWGPTSTVPEGPFFEEVSDFQNDFTATNTSLEQLYVSDKNGQQIEDALAQVKTKFAESQNPENGKTLIMVGNGHDVNWNVPSDPTFTILTEMAAAGIKVYSIAIPGVPANGNSEYCVIIDAWLQMHNMTQAGTENVDWGDTDHKMYIVKTPEDLDYVEDQIFRKLHTSNCSNTYEENCTGVDRYTHGNNCSDTFPENPCEAD